MTPSFKIKNTTIIITIIIVVIIIISHLQEIMMEMHKMHAIEIYQTIYRKQMLTAAAAKQKHKKSMSK